MWDLAYQSNDLYLTSLVTLTKHAIAFPNNCLILAPRPQNPVLIQWQKLTLEYLENPCHSVDEIDRHPCLTRVAHHRSDPSFGVLGSLAAYFGVLWTLTDVLYYEPSVREYVKNHVHILPTFRWSFDFMMVEMPSLTDKEIYTKVSTSEAWPVWLPRIPLAVDFNFRDDERLAVRLLALGNAFKVSSDFSLDFNKPLEYHISRTSTISRIYRSVIDTSLMPTRQADSDGAYKIRPFED